MNCFAIVAVSLILAFVPSFAGVIYVPGDQPTIQDGINTAVNGDTVLVADGTYTENINFRGKAITVASHFIMDGNNSHVDNTIIDGSQPSNPDSGSVVTFNSGEDTTSVLTGFTITGGSGTITTYDWRGGTYPTRAGGGIHCYFAGGHISDNYIHDNHIPQYTNSSGGGVCISQVGSSNPPYVIIEDNRITDNSITGTEAVGSGVLLPNGRVKNNDILRNATIGSTLVYGAVVCAADGNLTQSVLIENNRISHNTVSGGNDVWCAGLSVEWKMSAAIIGNEISFNEVSGASGSAKGGGLVVQFLWGTITIYQNAIVGNALNDPGSYGGGISLWATPTTNNNIGITNNIISGNSASFGGGIHSENSKTQIINNTIVNNSATTGGGISTNNSQPVVINTIVWDNQPTTNPQISGIPAVRYSDIQDTLWPGEGNINADPQFVAGDSLFHLTPDPSSPCVNTGADSIQIGGQWYYSPPDDYDGNQRPFPGSKPDIGADETDVPFGIEPQPAAGIPQSYALSQNYPNPFNPTTNIEFSIPKSEFVTLKVYNILGEEVATLISERLTPGKYKYDWNASSLASGVYLYRIQAGDYVEGKKMVLIK